MRLGKACIAFAVMVPAGHAVAMNMTHPLVLETNPLGPATAAYDEATHEGISASNFAVRADFNVRGAFSTGPEFWVGNYTRRGIDPNGQPLPRQDLWPGEQQKLNASRFRWNISFWEIPESMRGWMLQLGYDYTKIDVKANLYSDDPSASLPTGIPLDQPLDETDIVTDVRHGAHFTVGERWIFAGTYTLTVAMSFNTIIKRSVSVTSKDTKTREIYNDLIEDLPNFCVSARPYPEASMGLGYSF